MKSSLRMTQWLQVALVLLSAQAIWCYQRPQSSQDCIVGGANKTASKLFPTEFLVIGEKSETTTAYTQVSVAKGFSVQYYNQYKLVNNSYAGEVYVLYQCGVPPPPTAAFPNGTKFFEIPLSAVSVTDTSAYAFLDGLGVADRIQSTSGLTSSPCGQKLALSCGKVAVSNFTNASALAAQDTNVDAILTFSKTAAVPKAFAFSAALDPGVLNRLEWVKYLGLFFNLDRTASQYYNNVVAEFKALAATASAAAANASEPRPVVAWISHFVYLKDESYQVSFAPYKAEYTVAAGAVMPNITALLATPGVTTSPLSKTTVVFGWGPGGFRSKEEAAMAFQDFLETVDVVVDETYAPDPTKYTYATFLKEMNITAADAPYYAFAENGIVLREDGLISSSFGQDWFEGAVAKPHEVLRDFVRALHPELLPAGARATWLRNIFAGEAPTVVGPALCSSLASCTSEPRSICPFVQICPSGATVPRLANAACSYAACPTTAGS